MEAYDERIIVMRRQIESLQGAVVFFQNQQRKDAEALVILQSNLQQLTVQVQALTQQVAMLRAVTMGCGPTVR